MADSPTVIQSCDVRPPSGAAAPTKEQQLSGTGTTSAGNTTALTVGEMATLLNGAEPVRIGFGSSKAAAETDADASAIILGPYGRYDWMVSERDKHVAARVVSGSAAYEASCWTSSGARAAS
jgi:hypothetical protein